MEQIKNYLFTNEAKSSIALSKEIANELVGSTWKRGSTE